MKEEERKEGFRETWDRWIHRKGSRSRRTSTKPALGKHPGKDLRTLISPITNPDCTGLMKEPAALPPQDRKMRAKRAEYEIHFYMGQHGNLFCLTMHSCDKCCFWFS